MSVPLVWRSGKKLLLNKLMITLNLIPPEQKKLLKVKRLFLLLRNLSGLILFFTIIIAIILTLINYSLTLSSELSQLNQKNLTFDEKGIKEINSKLKNINDIQTQHLYWPTTLRSIIEMIPTGVELKNLEIDSTQLVKIEGVARTRNDYLNMLTALNNSEKIKDLESPLENLYSKENINFNLTLKYQF